MANNQINKLLEFANMQMAAEAFIVRAGQGSSAPIPSDDVVRARLVDGNTHASRFTQVQAEQFTAKYEVLTQYRNDPLKPGDTGFSATLLKNRTTNELTLSIRSTEFIDDAVRDSKATGELEIMELGWAFGQIAEMEAWYQNTLRGLGGALVGKSFNVTGYSLGGHLATAFNILRREEAQATGAPNPVLATTTFNGAGTGGLLNDKRLTDLISDFNQIRQDYIASPQWNALSPAQKISIRNNAISRAQAIASEQTRVAGLSGVQRAFGAAAPLGVQAEVGYQIAALIVGRDTSGSPVSALGNVQPAPPGQGFPNLTEVVGMETNGLATSYVSNSGIHYGTRASAPIEAQPLYRGNFLLQTVTNTILNQNIKLLGNNPGQNDFADTHSLVLLVDSLSLMAAMEKLAPAITIETAKQLFAAISGARSEEKTGTQGKAEGDTLEKMLDALRAIVFGPGQIATLTEDNMRKVLEGNTWADAALRAAFQSNVKTLQEQVVSLTAQGGSFQFDSLVTTPAETIKNLALTPDILAYRHALKELNPFALVGESANAKLYSWHNIKGELDLYNPADRTGALTGEWITDRASFLAWKNLAYTQNTPTNNAGVTLLQTNQITDAVRFIDLAQNLDLGVVPLGGGMPALNSAPRYVFGGDSADAVVGGAQAERLYGGGGADYVQGKGGNDYLEGGSGRDIYEYNGYAGLSGGNDGDDVIRDTDGKGVLRYVWHDNPAPKSTVIADASVKVQGMDYMNKNKYLGNHAA